MAEPSTTTPVGPDGQPARPPALAPLLIAYTLGRLLVAGVLVALLWSVGLVGIPALLFGLLLSMPVSFVLLRSLRERLTEALVARGEVRRRSKEELRARLKGSE
ncbi:DUF4229 domain-containing protein [Modestobacter sp. I12A-02628]|uniref:DUF4229 domain-containing protein n=1 Tax=Goekera deserti TaxID=2497753 RepID=A0A7K3WAG2_9ACTN|nr:DUF4229 domain-containing protein [Goekera deserti]MPR00509.1 DUF4229 domain-containing protein [Goekera deserti]NDI49092.1 DUF4229 domain-containing protein [Goekera deserti]NEL52830.1 DUF4229 domain-containing protein [Goekera deserti]